MASFRKLSPEEILLRWINFHLGHAKHDKKVSNFESDLKDGSVYVVLLH